MLKLIRHSAALALFILAVSATGQALAEEKTAEAPKGELKCSQSMEITDPRFGSTAEVGVPVRFGDLGCAFVFRKTACATEQMNFDSSAIVHDYYTGETVKMESATFVLDEKLVTPLGFGIAAFKDKASAERYVTENGRGKIYSFAALTEISLQK